MKKLLAILCVLAMLCMLCVPAFAYEGLNSLAIVGAGIPGVKDWDPADAAGEMEEVEDGVFVKEISLTAGTTMTFKFAGNDEWNDAFNFGSATIEAGKTADLTCGSGSQNMTVTVSKDTTLKLTVNVNPMAEGGAATLLVEGDGIGEAPVVTYDSYYVAGQAGLVGEDWIVDGAKMDEVSDGVYELTFTDIAAGEYQFKVTAGTWDANWGGDGPDGNYLITVEETSDVTITFDSASTTISVDIQASEEPVDPPVTDPTDPSEDETTAPSEDVTDPSEDPSVDPSEDPSVDPSEDPSVDPSEDPSAPTEDDGMITVYCDPFNDWEGVNLYFWGGLETAAWPGYPMTDDDGDGWYEYNIAPGTPNIIVNTGTGSPQSVDLTIDGTTDVWVIVNGVGSDGKVTCDIVYENPGAASDATSTSGSTDTTEPSEPAEDETTAPTAATVPTQSPEELAKKEAERIEARNKTLIILAIVLVVIIIIACILSIPKKLV